MDYSLFQHWNETLFFKQVAAKCEPAVADVVRQIYDWAQVRHGIVWGRGQQNPAFHILGPRKKVAYIAADGWAWLALGQLRKVPPFGEDHRRRELVDRFNAIPGIRIRDKPIPKLCLQDVPVPEGMQQFLDVLDWAMNEVRRADPDRRFSPPPG